MPTPIPEETRVLAAALDGDSAAFAALVEPYRRPLLRHGYRLSGSLADAEDLVQETFLRAWNQLPAFQGSGAFRSWLYTIATRLWLDEVRRRKRQVLLPFDGPPADPDAAPSPPDGTAAWLDPLPDGWLAGRERSAERAVEERESVSLAFLIALQKLNPRQRVVLLLRAVYEWSAADVAAALGSSTAAVNNHLYRARQTLDAWPAGETPVADGALEAFVRPWEAGDVPGLIALLHQDAAFAMPPLAVWYDGRKAIGRALKNFVFLPETGWRLRPTGINGQPGFGIFQLAAAGRTDEPFGLILPHAGRNGHRIGRLTAFLSPSLLPRFGF